MRSYRARPVGWRNESYRHYLAAKGISTTRRYNFKRFPIKDFTKKGDRIICPDCGGHVQEEPGDWDCKNEAVVIEEDGRMRTVGQCCCYNKEHHFARKNGYFAEKTREESEFDLKSMLFRLSDEGKLHAKERELGFEPLGKVAETEAALFNNDFVKYSELVKEDDDDEW